MKSVLPIGLFVVFAAAPALAAPYEGRWAQEPEWCANDADSGTEEIAIEISGKTIRYYEGTCEMASIEDIGVWDAAWKAHLVCTTEDETVEFDMIMAAGGGKPFGEPRFLTQVHMDEGFVRILHLCPPR